MIIYKQLMIIHQNHGNKYDTSTISDEETKTHPSAVEK